PNMREAARNTSITVGGNSAARRESAVHLGRWMGLYSGSVLSRHLAAPPPTASGDAAWALPEAISSALCRITSASRGICPRPRTRSHRYAQKLTPNFRLVSFKLANVSRQRLPASLRVLPEILRVFT